jgi:hypothetical protein
LNFDPCTNAAQIHKWKGSLQPDNLVAYALADPKPSAHGITADGGAFRVKRRWYGINSNATPRPFEYGDGV